mgnify:CR=1 FL=1
MRDKHIRKTRTRQHHNTHLPSEARPALVAVHPHQLSSPRLWVDEQVDGAERHETVRRRQLDAHTALERIVLAYIAALPVEPLDRD